MPPVKDSNALLRRYCALSNALKVTSGILFCKICECKVSHEKKSHVSQHLESEKHRRNEQLQRSHTQSNITFPVDSRAEKWALALAQAGVPFSKFENKEFKSFLEKELGYKLPSESVLRKHYLEQAFERKRQEMVDLLKNEKFYIIFDETKNKKMENVTRWGTWVKCGIYLGKNWCVIADWVKNLEDDGIIVADAKRAFADISAQEELLELFPLEPALQYQTKLESHGSTLVERHMRHWYQLR